eukprot:TRINITY_DN13004_c0_g1_i2.p1 TRINITY_DN13004_c0_g1~~TRINITY_DN13004_c0_g1_i2.p1  ORF type:complete len:639 (-),score=121.84 TRINITY_DN13004_c0_g1_i2:351-2267(-)
MGNFVPNCSSNPCFAGFTSFNKNTRMKEDLASRPRVERVHSFEEAMSLDRPRCGSFMPSPGRQLDFSRCNSLSLDWASPLPRQSDNGDTQEGDVDFDLIIDEGASPSEYRPVSSLLDTDIPSSRIASKSKSRQAEKRTRYELEQLVASPGQLPKPMSSKEREELVGQILPTATHEMLAKVPTELLDKHDEASQTLRRKLIKGSTIVYVSAGMPGKRFTFELAAELGVKIVILEHPDSWSRSLVDEGIAAKFLPIDMTQSSDEIFKQAVSLIRSLGEDGLTGAADGIASFVELSIPLVARLTEALGLPGHLPSAVDSARNKHQTRACLKAANLPTPRNFLISSEKDLSTALKQVGLPAVLKPVSGAASLGVKKVENEGDFKSIYQEIVDELSTLVISSGALIQGQPNGGGHKATQAIDLTVLMEQFLDGPEVDVDVVFSEGEYRYACVSDNGPTLEPYFNETWAVCPSLLPKDRQRALKDLAINSVKALGFESGVFHVECKYTSHGPHLIEVNARMGGGQVHECNFRTWGVCLVEETLISALGIPNRPKVPKLPLSAVAYCYVNAPRSGKVVDMSLLEEIRRRDGVVWAKPLTLLGMKAVGPEEGLPTWLCDLFVAAPTAQAALKKLQDIEAEGPVEVG